jgi:succinate dehydrogenase/fumarate reductase flavoprotein subunit
MVFAPRIVEAIERGQDEPSATGAMRAVLGGDPEIPGRVLDGDPIVAPVVDVPAAELRARIQQAMTAGAGVVRTAGSLDLARQALAAPPGDTPADHEVRNLATVGEALVRAALARTESRGNHWRSDHPEPDEALRVRLVHKRP